MNKHVFLCWMGLLLVASMKPLSASADLAIGQNAGLKSVASFLPSDSADAEGNSQFPVIAEPPSAYRREVGRRDFGLGRKIPSYVLADAAGNSAGMNRWQGKILVVDLWMTSCGPCLKSMPQLNEFARSYQGRSIAFVSVCCYGGPDKRIFDDEAAKYAASWLPFYLDPQIDQKHDICAALDNTTGKPTQIIFSRSGRCIGVLIGEDDGPDPFKTLKKSVDLALNTKAGS